MPNLDHLIQPFYESARALAEFDAVGEDELPDVFRTLLAHDDHMTVTLEAWHNSLVDLQVLKEHRDGNTYAREILLKKQRDARVVQYGIMHIDLGGLPEIVRLEIESQALPLGRVMIRHHLLREVELVGLWKVTPAEALAGYLQLPVGSVTYGRSARILVDGRPAVELLEIVTG